MSTQTVEPLNRANLSARYPETDTIKRPVRIVHIGLGAFFRAHQAWFTEQVDSAGEWGIAAFTGRSADMAKKLNPQDGLYTLLVRGAESDQPEFIKALSEVRAANELDQLQRIIAAPETAVVTLTITEAGYAANSAGEIDLESQAVQHELELLKAERFDELSNALARLTVALKARYKANAGPIAVVPCDNLPGNGALAQSAINAYASGLGEEFARWVRDNVAFSSTSIDRITPRTTETDREKVAELTGFDDAAPVICEPFTSWIIEGEFPAGRPAWEKAGAIFTDDLEPFENRKLWLLNGSHTLMANFATIKGHHTVAQAIGDSAVRTQIEQWWDEAENNLSTDLDVPAYRAALIERFENPNIEHKLEQIAGDSLQKLRVRLAPVALKELEAGRPTPGAVTAISGWIWQVLNGKSANDSQQQAIDEAKNSGEEAEQIQSLLKLVSPELAKNTSFAEGITSAVEIYS